MASANQRLYEATIRHQVSLLRYAEGRADDIAQIIREAEQELLDKISGAMARGASTERFEKLLVSLRKRRAETYAEVADKLEEQLASLAATEATWEARALQNAAPVTLQLATVSREQLTALATQPIQGIPIRGWTESIADAEMRKLQQAVNMSVTQGETVDDLVRRIRGSKANGYRDGILSTSTRSAQALARTAVNHVSNQSRELVWDANSDIMQALRWTSTLDGRTSSVCQSRDGKLIQIGQNSLPPSTAEQELQPQGARPPAHFNCRSVLVPILEGESLVPEDGSTRPFVADDRTRRERENAFRREARAEGVSTADIRKRWRDENVGQVPASMDYDGWLRTQDAAFQNEVLGPARAKIFRQGTRVDKFSDYTGRRLNLDELREELGL